MLVQILEVEKAIRRLPENGVAWEALCNVVNALLETQFQQERDDEHFFGETAGTVSKGNEESGAEERHAIADVASAGAAERQSPSMIERYFARYGERPAVRRSIESDK